MGKKAQTPNLNQTHSEKYTSIVKGCVFVNNKKHYFLFEDFFPSQEFILQCFAVSQTVDFRRALMVPQS